ncbi:hypothetical protein PDJAM_G00072900 [Pangasius djambal]|uniref:Uncharacterized protein n=1 Tax=Pangasius djambal TaxID=1691987 RepID=A0ACC5Z1T3_9TELE|nr:hypothetical protein [Pangasius djambal]
MCVYGSNQHAVPSVREKRLQKHSSFTAWQQHLQGKSPPKTTLPMMHHKPLSKMSVGHVVLQHMSIRRNPADQHTDCSLFRDGHTRGTSPIH